MIPTSLPHSIDAEKGLLCSLVLAPRIFDEAGVLEKGLFYIPAHKLIFEHILDTFQDHGTTDFFIVRDSFRLLEISEIGGIQYLSELYGFVQTCENWRFYLDRLLELYTRRATIASSQALLQRCMDLQSECERPIREICEKGLLAIALNVQNVQTHRFKEEVRELRREIFSKETPRGYIEATGIRALDLALGGLFPGDQLVIGAQTNFGKTALALQIAAHVALGDQKKRVAVFSLEMSRKDIVMRIISARANIRMKALRYRELSAQDSARFEAFEDSIPDEETIEIEDGYSMDLAGIVSACRRLKATTGLDMVIVDYLQLVNPATKTEANRQREVADISRRLKVMAGELSIVVVALSQLNDEGRLRESRAIGQDCDILLIIREPKDSEDASLREICIDKARNGPHGQRVKVDFFGDYVSFANKS